MRILYRNREAWLDPIEQSAGLEAEEREALALFSAALPNVPASIELADGFLSYQLTSNDRVDDADEPTMAAEYAFDVYAPSLLPWPAPSEEQKAPGRAALGRIRQAVDSAQRDWESNDFAAVVQKLEEIEREAHELIEPASKLIKNYMP